MLNNLIKVASEIEKKKSTQGLAEILNDVSKASNNTTLVKTTTNNPKTSQSIKDDEEKLFKYFLKTRWFFFENKEMFFYDKWSGFLWANLDNYETIATYPKTNEEIVNKLNWHGIGTWEIPSIIDFRNFLKGDKPRWFDEKSDDYILKKKELWLTKEFMFYVESDTTGSIESFFTLCLLPCNKKFVSTKLKNSSSNEFVNKDYEIGQIKEIINLFIEQDFIPKFYESEFASLYNNYVNRLKNPEASNNNDDEPQINEEALIETHFGTNFNLNDLILNLNAKGVDSSPLKFYQVTISWVEQLLNSIIDFETKNPKLMTSIKKLTGLKSFNLTDLKLNDKEKTFFHSEIKKTNNVFDFEFTQEKEILSNFAIEARNIIQEMALTHDCKNPLEFLSNVEHTKRPSFTFLIEYTVNLIESKIKKIKWFENKANEITKITEELTIHLEQYGSFINSGFKSFEQKLNNEGIEADRIVEWFAKWREEQFIVVKKIFSLLNFVEQVDSIPVNIIIRVLSCLKHYQQDIDKFFKGEVVNIHKKYAFQTDGKYQEKFETEMQLANIVSKFSASIKEVIFACDTISQKVLLYRWSADWFSLQVDQIVTFSEANNIDEFTPVFKNILSKIEKLNSKNLEQYLNDLQTYSKFMKKRDDEFNNLMFKMRKELDKGV